MYFEKLTQEAFMGLARQLVRFVLSSLTARAVTSYDALPIHGMMYSMTGLPKGIQIGNYMNMVHVNHITKP